MSLKAKTFIFSVMFGASYFAFAASYNPTPSQCQQRYNQCMGAAGTPNPAGGTVNAQQCYDSYQLCMAAAT